MKNNEANANDINVAETQLNSVRFKAIARGFHQTNTVLIQVSVDTASDGNETCARVSRLTDQEDHLPGESAKEWLEEWGNKG